LRPALAHQPNGLITIRHLADPSGGTSEHFPLSREVSSAAPAVDRLVQVHSMHVLLVEDEPLIRAVMREALTDDGFTVTESGDGTAALAEFRQNRADLLFTDIGLPGPVDGFALAEQLRSLAPDLPIIFATGKGNVAMREAPNAVFIEKPYSPFTVIREMRTLLAKSRTQPRKDRR
jgi:DNA-binding response OmpR family regulator